MSRLDPPPVSRRSFLSLAAVGSFFAALGTAAVGMLRLPNPSVLPGPVRRFKLGPPEEFSAGSETPFAWCRVFAVFPWLRLRVPSICGPTSSRDARARRCRRGGPHAAGLSSEEVTAVIEYLRNGAAVAPAMLAPMPTGDAQRRLSLFLRNCYGCHGMNGRGGIAPEIGNPVFQQAATDAFIVRTIQNGRVGTAMPAFQRKEAPDFSDQGVADELAYLRRLRAPETKKAMAQNVTSSAPSGGRP